MKWSACRRTLPSCANMAINNTQKSVINKKRELRALIKEALESSPNFQDVYFEVVGDCDIAFYVTNDKGIKQVFELSGSFKKNNTKLGGDREAEDVMCDLLDKYDAKLEDRRCREALAASNKANKLKK